MLKQPEIEFPSATTILVTDSPINKARILGQARRLLDYLLTGQKIHCFHPAMKYLRIGHLHSRISQLTNANEIPIKREMIKAIDFFGNEADCKEYWMEENEIELFKKKMILK